MFCSASLAVFCSFLFIVVPTYLGWMNKSPGLVYSGWDLEDALTFTAISGGQAAIIHSQLLLYPSLPNKSFWIYVCLLNYLGLGFWFFLGFGYFIEAFFFAVSQAAYGIGLLWLRSLAQSFREPEGPKSNPTSHLDVY